MLQQIQNHEASLVATLKQATACLDAVGTRGLAAAVADLHRAAAEAQARLQAAADHARSVFSALAGEAGVIAASLAADLFGTAEPAIAVGVVAMLAIETNAAPVVTAAQPPAVQEEPHVASAPTIAATARGQAETPEAPSVALACVQGTPSAIADGASSWPAGQALPVAPGLPADAVVSVAANKPVEGEGVAPDGNASGRKRRGKRA